MYLTYRTASRAAYAQVKRRWDDDVVFKNQARTEPKRQKRFINDTVRSDFHRRFLDRYVK
jgi:protein CWC15